MSRATRPPLPLLFMLFELGLARSRTTGFQYHRHPSSSLRDIRRVDHFAPSEKHPLSTTRGHLHGRAASAAMFSTGGGIINAVERSPLLTTLFGSPVFWSVAVMLSIVALLWTWEETVETLKEKSPKTVRSVIDQILGEMGGLGFIGLVLSVALNRQLGLGELFGNLSEHFLGDREILLESFEFLHEVFFQTAMVFFLSAGAIILRVLETINAVTELARNQIESGREDKDDPELAENIAKILNAQDLPAATTASVSAGRAWPDSVAVDPQVTSMEEYEAVVFVSENDPNLNPFLREFSLSAKQRGAEILTLRYRIMREMKLPESFRITTYLEQVFTQNKLDIVKIDPTSWIPLIPAIALTNAVDLAHDVSSPQSSNAAMASGFFFSTPWVLWPSVALQMLCLGWCLWNFYKMAVIKAMLMPTLVRDEAAGGNLRLLPPSVESPILRAAFDSTPLLLVKPIEQLFSQPATNRVEDLFGTVGAGGTSFYLNSIKFQTWLSVTCIVVFAFQILPRDVYAMLNPELSVGDPTHLVPEVVFYSSMTLLSALELCLVPTIFLNYCLVTCVEDMVKTELLENALFPDAYSV